MTEISTALTAASGEHFVADELSRRGYCAAPTRAGFRGVHVIASTLGGERAVSLQVKTERSARSGIRKPDWSWDVGKGALAVNGDDIYYALVDLKSESSGTAPERPDVYIIPSAVIFNHVKPDFTRFRFWMYEDERQSYLERWDLIESAIAATA